MNPKNPFAIFQNTRFQIFFLILLTSLAYSPVFHNGFVWDDDALLHNNVVRVHDGLYKIWFHPSEINLEAHYWPVVYTSFWLEYHLWGFNPLGYHLVNLLLHILISILVWLILTKMKIPGAFLAGLLFALHPVHVESVAWVIERKDLLSGLFYLLTFDCYLQFEDNKNRKVYILGILFFIIAMLSKSIVFSFPLALFLYLWWKKESLGKSDFLNVIPFALVAIVMAFLDVMYSHSSVPVHLGLSFSNKIYIASHSLWFYFENMIFPFNLMAIYPRWSLQTGVLLKIFYPISILLVLVILRVRKSLWGKGPLACVLYSCITLGPVLGFIDFDYMYHSFVADRYQYLASLGLIILFSSSVSIFVDTFHASLRTIFQFILVLLVFFLGFLTFHRTLTYKNSETLFRANVQLNPYSWGAYNNLGVALLQKGDFTGAIDSYQKALNIRPNYPEALNNLGNVFSRVDKLEDAIQCYQLAMTSKKDYAEAHNNLGMVYVKQNKLDMAISEYSTALVLKKNYPDAEINLALLLVKQNKLKEAEDYYLKTLESNPDFPQAHNNYANLLAQENRLDDAIIHYKKAIQLNPDFAPAYNNLGIAQAKKGYLLDAFSNISTALHLDPTFEDASVNYNVIQNALNQISRDSTK